MRTLAASFVASITTLSLAAPVSAADGWLTDEDTLYHLDGTSLALTQQGNVSHAFTAVAVGPGDVLRGIADDGSGPVLHTIDTSTGGSTPVGQVSGDSQELFGGLATLADGRIVAASQDTGSLSETVGRVWSLDPDTGVGEPLNTMDGVVVTLAGGCADTVFGVNESNRLVAVDPATGTVTPGVTLQLPVGESPMALSFDHAARELQLLSDAGFLYDIDPVTGEDSKTTFTRPTGAGQLTTLALDAPEACRYTGDASLSWSRRLSRFSGDLDVQDDFPPCTAGRKVKLMRVRPGPDAMVASTTTNRRGRFQVPTAARSGTYRAVVPREADPQGTCLATQSPRVTVKRG